MTIAHLVVGSGEEEGWKKYDCGPHLYYTCIIYNIVCTLQCTGTAATTTTRAHDLKGNIVNFLLGKS